MQILVLGMHRSGTSIAARLLNMMGVYFAPEGAEMPAHGMNPKGFWERKDVNQLCIKLLASVGCDWHRLSDFNLDLLPADAVAEFKEESRRIILGLDAHRPWFVKDPRLCLLAPLWLELLEMPVCVFVHRSPLEVAQSLQMRDGFALPLGLALWERYNVDALNATIGHPRIQINHADLMSEPVATIGRFSHNLETAGVRGLRAPSEDEIRAFIDPALYRANEKQVANAVPVTTSQKKLRNAFQTGKVLHFTVPITFPDSARQILIEHDRAVAAQQRIVELEARTLAAEKKIARLEQRNAALSGELLGARTQLASGEKKLTEKLQLLKAAKEDAAKNAAISKQISDALRQGLELLRQQAKAEVELHQREAEISKLRQDIRDQTKAINLRQASLNQSIARRDAALAEQRAKIGELNDKIRILKEGLATVEQYFRKLRESRSFHFAIYTARRLGLVSRNPRRCVEAIKDQFPAIRKALKQLSNAEARPGAPAVTTETTVSAQKKRTDPQRDKVSTAERIAPAVGFRKTASARNAVALPLTPLPAGASVCFIILHRTGEHHLHNLFNSFLKVNTFPAVEFSIVLHACTDGSREVIESFRNRLRIAVTDHLENKSFAYSNNRAAEKTTANYLVFLNNDVIFEQDVVPDLLRCLQDSRNGIAGLRLNFPPDDPNYPLGLQHAGIKFRPDPGHFFYRPFNLGAPDYISETPRVLEKFPAVTAAIAACHRRDFLAVGGFCEDYLYGYEDVDLCLTFRRLLGLRSVSANQISCIHPESTTRRLELNEATRQYRLNNINHLVRRHGWYLRRQILRDKMAGNLFFFRCHTNNRLCGHRSHTKHSCRRFFQRVGISRGVRERIRLAYPISRAQQGLVRPDRRRCADRIAGRL